MNDMQPEASKADILVVDDTRANLRLLSQMLAEQGYHVRPVPDGSLALAAVRAQPPDLILLDIRMPGMNGYEVCEQLKSDPQTHDIPIIFISALDAIEDKVKAFAVGGEDYVTKPFNAEEVLARVGTHLALRNLQVQLQEANQKMATELSLAGEVQASFLPLDLPAFPDWQLAATLNPARETSGDFYDFISLPNGRLAIVIADVCDKGAGAALYMALSRTLIRTFAVEYPDQPQSVMNAVNRRIIKDTKTNQFVTAFYGILEPATGTMEYCNAGHCWPILLNGDARGNSRRLMGSGVPLGIFADQTWQQGSVRLAPGDALVLFTDGIIEAENAQGEFLGEDQFLECLVSNLGQPARKIQDAVLADIHKFVGETPQSDDIALVILLREPAAHA